MIFINEWLPNPAGNDAQGEWVELFNNGNAPVNLNGWVLKTGGTGKFNLKSTIGAGEYLVLKRTDTKLVLKNTDESLFLYNSAGNLADQSSFLGSAPEGKSFARILGADGSYRFVWSEPTPGAINKIAANNLVSINNYPTSIPLNPTLGASGFLGLLLGSSLVLTALVMFVLKRNENLFKLFFRGDEEIR